MKRQIFRFVPLIIVTNIIVFIGWNYDSVDKAWMAENFLISWDSIVEKRYWTLLTAAFSHMAVWHIFVNMFILKSFGAIVEEVLGSFRFVKFYLLASIISSLSHALVSAFILKSPELPALGASGAVAGVVLMFSLMFPKQKILLLGIIPLPAIWGALGFVAIDLWGVFAQAKGGGFAIGHGAHLGGALTGALYFLFAIRPQKKRVL